MSTPKCRFDISDIYLACRHGDVEFVKDYLKKLSETKQDANHFESGIKSSLLHTASYHGHKEIVKLLLDHDCDRSLVNGHGITAYEVAANDEIRQLYKRRTNSSDAHRFQDETTDGCFEIVKLPKENTEEKASSTAKSSHKAKRTPSVQGYKTDAEKKLEVGYATTSIAMCQSKLGRFMADTFQRGAPMSLRSMGRRLQELIDQEITAKKDPSSGKANELLNKFLLGSDDRSVEHLIRLYTLETKFYHALKQNPIPLALPLYMAAKPLKDRFFQGRSYRGAKLDDDDIATYQWAVENPGSLLQTRHFSSTSLLRSVAEEFLMSENRNEQDIRRKPALFIFNFPEKCDQTINLSRISHEQPCLSEYENEAEVLILPWTLFQVDSVTRESPSSPCIICLTNVVLPNKNMWWSLKWILRHPKGSVDRFNEHFPERQPETIVKELMESYPITDERF